MCFNKPRDKGLSLPCALGLPSNSADYTRLAPANAAGGGGGFPARVRKPVDGKTRRSRDTPEQVNELLLLRRQ